ncbi:hypothetical protein [Streptosporangium roseum]|uniref:hypothetical protein n=1 Tax=Streptosporangium roseum TaxID=2001 RepID=UPI001E3FA409|nr:hypothetical protein [Streptosporangium roseum]
MTVVRNDHNQMMESQDSLLLQAAQMCPANVRTEEAGIGVADVLDYLKHDEWEMALLLLEDVGDAHPQPAEFWSLLAEAARQMWLHKDVAWCEWRASEARVGAVLAELCLARREDGGRALPVPPGHVLKPLWDVGLRAPGGDPLFCIAGLWIEGRDPLEPGGCSSVRLAPFTFEHWRHFKPGDVVTMHEGQPPVGTARIIELISPVAGTS